ncbi:MAG: Kae1-associated serine/threonine protein kinase [Nanoarchaeota archaeon]|nr:Kae1-associated serine/threonine protein kinase [Nanoarchaeota archaeon]MBU1028226.1 Kae1-associated serine/threonine protein kinase [Nanoarchaeota archaeon]
MTKVIAQGAEANIIKIRNKIVKDRILKKYRLPELDLKIRQKRTKSENKLLVKASKIINCPIPLADPGQGRMIHIPFIDGKKLSDHLDKLKNKLQVCKQIGKDIAKLHDHNIIHGDLTTSNMILVKDKIFFIDFGLGYISHKIEDKAVDLHLLKQALEAKHYKHYKQLWKAVESGYKTSNESKKILERLKAVEKRGRYKKH